MTLRLEPGARLVAATHNPGKARELAELLGERFEVVTAGQLGLAEPDEPETTFAGNAMVKARAAADASGLVAIADDSGLCVAALEGAPGVHSARWAGPDRDFVHAMALVESQAGSVTPFRSDGLYQTPLSLMGTAGHAEITAAIQLAGFDDITNHNIQAPAGAIQ